MLTTTSEIPVGGGTIFADEQVVVTQPTEGEFKAFTAVCTHQGCHVSSVSDGTINCACHGSQFSIDDGSVEPGPATLAARRGRRSPSTATRSSGLAEPRPAACSRAPVLVAR